VSNNISKLKSTVMDKCTSLHLVVLHFFLEDYVRRFPDFTEGMVAIFVDITERSKLNFKEIITLILGNQSLVMSFKKDRVGSTDLSHIQYLLCDLK
jgi:hypothetical protein